MTDELAAWAAESGCTLDIQVYTPRVNRGEEPRIGESHMPQQVHLRWWACVGFYALTLSTIGSPGTAAEQAVLTAGLAPDPTGQGEFAVATSQYRLPASTDPTVMT